MSSTAKQGGPICWNMRLFTAPQAVADMHAAAGSKLEYIYIYIYMCVKMSQVNKVSIAT